MQKKIHQTKKGFTLIEMIVVIAMIATITTLVVFNSAKLNSSILVSNTAYEIGLIVRETQVAGLGVRAATDTSGANSFASSHGVHFDIATPSKIIIFADKNQNGIYDSGETTQEYDITNKRSGTILDICAKLQGSTGLCTSTEGSFTHPLKADIVFTRPNPEAFFKITTNPNESGLTYTPHSGALIINVGFAGDICRSVIIEKTGSVQVDTTYCPPIIN